MVSFGEKAKIKKVENLNQGCSYVITTVHAVISYFANVGLKGFSVLVYLSFKTIIIFFHFSSAGSGNSNANHTTSLNNATANAVPHSRNNLNRKVRSPPLGSPTGYTSNGYFGGNFYGGGRFAENLPEYRHEPPKTPPHILLHYSTFKVQAIQKVLHR